MNGRIPAGMCVCVCVCGGGGRLDGRVHGGCVDIGLLVDYRSLSLGPDRRVHAVLRVQHFVAVASCHQTLKE